MQQPLVAALRWTAGLAGMVIVVVLAAACGSGSPSASSAPSAPADVSVALGKLVQYLHTHGGRGVYLRNAPASPNPDSILIIFHGFAVPGADPGSDQFGTAMQACQHMLSHGTPPSATELHHAILQGLKAARCMRSTPARRSSRRRPKRAGCSCHREAEVESRLTADSHPAHAAV